MPIISDFKADVNRSRFFSKIDLCQAYHQLELAPESRFITTFTTHEGLLQFKRFIYGTSSAAECFQNVLQQNLADMPGVKNIADDIIIHGKTREDRDGTLENSSKRLNRKTKSKKCKFLELEIKFCGLIFTDKGTKPDPERISSLTNAPAPRSTSEVRSFLGMANTCHEHIKDYAEITGPLRELTRKNTAFQWTPNHQRAFNQLKKALTPAPVMSYFDAQKRSILIEDGSPHGISGILCQREPHNISLSRSSIVNVRKPFFSNFIVLIVTGYVFGRETTPFRRFTPFRLTCQASIFAKSDEKPALMFAKRIEARYVRIVL